MHLMYPHQWAAILNLREYGFTTAEVGDGRFVSLLHHLAERVLVGNVLMYTPAHGSSTFLQHEAERWGLTGVRFCRPSDPAGNVMCVTKATRRFVKNYDYQTVVHRSGWYIQAKEM